MAPRMVVLDLGGDHQLARDLVAGGVFVPESIDIGDECTVVLRNGDAILQLHALCVYVAATGSGLQLVECTAELKQRIIALASGMTTGRTDTLEDASTVMLLRQTAKDSGGLDVDTILQARTTTGDDSGSLDIDTIMQLRRGEPRPGTDKLDEDDDNPATEEMSEEDEPQTEELSALELAALSRPDPDDATAGTYADADGAPAGEDTGGDSISYGEANDEDDADPERKLALNVHERLRGLTLVQQLRIAQKGEVSERIVLERMYGKNVWEALLRNPRITGPEVARIARMGALPRPLVEVIVANGGWLQIPEVRRALLGNPRLGTDQIHRVLRLLPKHELKLAGIQTAYPHAVRDAAKRMLREMG